MEGTSDGGVTWAPLPEGVCDVPAPPDGSNDGVHEIWFRDS